MEFPLTPPLDDMLAMDTFFDVEDGLTQMIDDLGMYDDAALCTFDESHDIDAKPEDLCGQALNDGPSEEAQNVQKPAAPSVAQQRIERTRERNRLAQARYRQRLKVAQFFTSVDQSLHGIMMMIIIIIGHHSMRLFLPIL